MSDERSTGGRDAQDTSRWTMKQWLEWRRWAQGVGFALGVEQMLAWWLGGREPNLGACTIAGALLMMAQRTQTAQEARNERRREP
jgi:hypothetical protein